jgi:hypothetical protein
MALDVSDVVRGGLLSGERKGITVAWQWLGTEVARVHAYHAAAGPHGHSLDLCLQYDQGDTLRVQRIELDVTKTRFGGGRHWFRCPILQEGVACGTRARLLYLPVWVLGRGAVAIFACRACWALTYRSRRESHRYDRFTVGSAGEKNHRLALFG